ncbi:MAG: isochorismatase family protein [Deltaproteobacteria bacterium]|nr:isochorismatase family protein [Deltaproteobacteria bacterium]
MAGTPYVTSASLDDRLRAWQASLDAHSRPRPLPPLEESALLVMDVQRYFSDPNSHAYLPALQAVLPRILALVTLMQKWWRGSIYEGPLAELAEPLDAHEPDLHLKKQTYSAFEGTCLASWLRKHSCESVVIVGVMTHLCVETSARHAFVLGFEPVIVADATAADDEAHHLGALRNLSHGFAPVTTSAEITRRLGGATRAQTLPAPAVPAKVPLLVAGGGPAGMAAALQAHRAGIRVVLCAPHGLGGQLRVAERVENYLGFPGGITGAHLAERMAAQLAAEGITPLPRAVIDVGRASQGWRAHLDDGEVIDAQAVILATGASIRPLPQVSPSLLTPYLHEGMTLQGKRVAIVGGGEAAFDQALLACRLRAKTVTLLARSAPHVLPRLQERAAALGVEQRIGVEIYAAATQDGTLTLDLSDDVQTLEVDHLVACVGKDSQLPKLPHTLRLRADGAIDVNDAGETSHGGLYVVGDARRGRHRQAAIAAGDGLTAAMAATCRLNEGNRRGRG